MAKYMYMYVHASVLHKLQRYQPPVPSPSMIQLFPFTQNGALNKYTYSYYNLIIPRPRHFKQISPVPELLYLPAAAKPTPSATGCAVHIALN